MKIGFSPESIVGLDGKPLVGRVTLFAHDSDTKIDVYTLEGDTFVQAANTQLLDNAGRLPATLFFEASIVDVNVEKYIGAEGMMSVDSPDSDFETFDTFETGFDPQELSPRTSIDTIDELMDTAVNNVAVNVVGYYGVGDCVPRTYYWDAESEDTIDGGYVVGSRIVDTGRWILLWNGEQLPSSVYGVIAGVNESNINAFLTYPSVVGSFGQKTAPMPRFEAGNYSTDVALVTTKAVAFDRGAKFTDAPITLKSAQMNGGWSGFVADFTFTDNAAVAHSSWFKTVDGFLTCGAFEYIVDEDNYFVNNSIISRRTLEKKKWVATSRLPVTYSDSGCIVFNGCAFVGTRFFNSSDIVAFANTVFRDEWFAMAASDFDFENKITCRSSALNALLLANFKSADVYLKAVTADGRTSVDLAGRKVSALSTQQFTDISNAVCDSVVIDEYGENVTLHNVMTPSLTARCSFLMIDGKSDVRFVAMPSVNALEVNDSAVSSSVTFSSIQVTATNSDFDVNIDEATDNENSGHAVYLVNCTMKNLSLKLKHLNMMRCYAESCTIKVYPYKENGTYKIYARLEGNAFDSSEPVEFTKVANDESCYGCEVDWTIVGNSFVGNDEGLRCRFWADRTGQHPGETFIDIGGNQNVISYSGNVGQCPSETAKGITASDINVSNWKVEQIGGIWVSMFTGYGGMGFVFPQLDGFTPGAYHYDMHPIDRTTCLLKKQNDSEGLYSENDAMIYPVAALEEIDNGSLFEYKISLFEQVSTASAGQVKTWYYL
jgi:hypothetical protein